MEIDGRSCCCNVLIRMVPLFQYLDGILKKMSSWFNQMRCIDALCSPFSSASAQPELFFRKGLVVCRHYSTYWCWRKFQSSPTFWMETAISVKNIFSERGEEMIVWRVHFDLKPVVWLCLSASGTALGHRSKATAPCAAPGAMQGLVQPFPALPPAAATEGGSLLQHIWWRKALWIGQGTQSDSVLLLWVVSCTKQYSGHGAETGELGFFFFPTGHLICFNLHAIYICKVKCLWSVYFLTPAHLQADTGCCILTWEAI